MKCKQCSKRFSNDEVGRKARDDHLDLHFRQNKRATQSAGRGHSRSWFVGIDVNYLSYLIDPIIDELSQNWIHDIADSLAASDIKGKGKAGGPVSAKAAAAAAAEREVKLRAMFVVVPPGDESKSVTCPICRETLQNEFLEEDEEWVWKNAVQVKGKVRARLRCVPIRGSNEDELISAMHGFQVYHATCHAETMSSAAVAVRRLKDTKLPVSRSRSRTPELTRNDRGTVRTSPPRSTLGLKRKGSPDEESEESLVLIIKQEPSDGEPPSKRARSSTPQLPAAAA